MARTGKKLKKSSAPEMDHRFAHMPKSSSSKSKRPTPLSPIPQNKPIKFMSIQKPTIQNPHWKTKQKSQTTHTS